LKFWLLKLICDTFLQSQLNYFQNPPAFEDYLPPVEDKIPLIWMLYPCVHYVTERQKIKRMCLDWLKF